jgi:hypothetical protein
MHERADLPSRLGEAIASDVVSSGVVMFSSGTRRR